MTQLAVGVTRWQQLAEQLAPGASQFELDYMGQVCTRLELSPFTSPPQIVLIGRHDSRVGRTVFRPQVTVDGRLALAVRSGRIVGLEGPHYTGPRELWTRDDGTRIWVDVWDCKDEGAYPRAARYLIHVAGWAKPVNGTAPWGEFRQTTTKGQLLPLWARMPTTMLAKTALSLGLRRAGIENLPADVAVAYEGDPELAALTGGENPGPAGAAVGPGPEHVIVHDDGTVMTCRCGEKFTSGGEFARHRDPPAVPATAEGTGPASPGSTSSGDPDAGPPVEVYDDSPESRNYDEAQPASYENPDPDDDGRPFT